jgi:hypothetical protein
LVINFLPLSCFFVFGITVFFSPHRHIGHIGAHRKVIIE